MLVKISSRLPQLRGMRGMTQEELAKETGVDLANIKRLEEGGQDARPVTASALAFTLRVPMDELRECSDTEQLFPVFLESGAEKPQRNEDGSFDLLAMKEQYLPRGGSAVVETGVSISLPQCCAALVVSHPELLRCDIIAADAPADGMIRVKLFNLSRETSYILQKGDPVGRLLIVPTADASLVRSLT